MRSSERGGWGMRHLNGGWEWCTCGESNACLHAKPCFVCSNPLDSAEHHAACVAPLDQIDGGAA